jgi:hypothetical protein
MRKILTSCALYIVSPESYRRVFGHPEKNNNKKSGKLMTWESTCNGKAI